MKSKKRTTLDQFLIIGANEERLYQEYQRYGTLVIAYDFDGTVHDYHKEGYSYEMVRKLIRDMREVGFTLVCWTAHPDPEVYVPKFLKDNNIPYDYINEGGIPLPWNNVKPFFSALLDDRCGLESMYRDLSNVVKRIKENKK